MFRKIWLWLHVLKTKDKDNPQIWRRNMISFHKEMAERQKDLELLNYSVRLSNSREKKKKKP